MNKINEPPPEDLYGHGLVPKGAKLQSGDTYFSGIDNKWYPTSDAGLENIVTYVYRRPIPCLPGERLMGLDENINIGLAAWFYVDGIRIFDEIKSGRFKTVKQWWTEMYHNKPGCAIFIKDEGKGEEPNSLTFFSKVRQSKEYQDAVSNRDWDTCINLILDAEKRFAQPSDKQLSRVFTGSGSVPVERNTEQPTDLCTCGLMRQFHLWNGACRKFTSQQPSKDAELFAKVQAVERAFNEYFNANYAPKHPNWNEDVYDWLRVFFKRGIQFVDPDYPMQPLLANDKAKGVDETCETDSQQMTTVSSPGPEETNGPSLSDELCQCGHKYSEHRFVGHDGNCALCKCLDFILAKSEGTETEDFIACICPRCHFEFEKWQEESEQPPSRWTPVASGLPEADKPFWSITAGNIHPHHKGETETAIKMYAGNSQWTHWQYMTIPQPPLDDAKRMEDEAFKNWFDTISGTTELDEVIARKAWHAAKRGKESGE